MTAFVSDYKVIADDVTRRLAGAEPYFLSRIGGSDTAAVVDYLRVRGAGATEVQSHLDRHLPVVSRYNGFYDLEHPRESYLAYVECLLDAYLKTSVCTLCNYQLLSIYFRNTLHQQFYAEEFENKASYITLISNIQVHLSDATFYPYQFIERMVFGNDTLFRAFSEALTGRKVLVVSPFSESIRANFVNRHHFFRHNYKYPDFDLELVNTPITYAGLPTAMYPHNNWFSTLETLKSEISERVFDIALLSCGSYAIPLGQHVKTELSKQAIYVGGVLQLFFGIMGRRYENPFFTDQINAEKFIYPLEREKYLKNVTIPDGMAREAFGAYF